jgi:hypothetical protein
VSWTLETICLQIIPHYHAEGIPISKLCEIHGWTPRKTPRRVFDAIIFSNELDLLEIRMRVRQNLASGFQVQLELKVGLLLLRLCIHRMILISNYGSGHVKADVEILSWNQNARYRFVYSSWNRYPCALWRDWLITLMHLLCRDIYTGCGRSTGIAKVFG